MWSVVRTTGLLNHLLLFLYIGQSWQEKVASVREKMKEEGAVALVVTALDEIACEQWYS